MPSDNDQAEQILEALELLKKKTDALTTRGLEPRVKALEDKMDNVDKAFGVLRTVINFLVKFIKGIF